jgi:hypothetical protein
MMTFLSLLNLCAALYMSFVLTIKVADMVVYRKSGKLNDIGFITALLWSFWIVFFNN